MVCVLAWGLQASCSAEGFRLTDLSVPRSAEYLVVSADGLAGACDGLLAFRQSQGLAAAEVTLGQVQALRPELPLEQALTAFVQQAHDSWGVRFVLLVGDAAGPEGMTIPMLVERSRFLSQQFLAEPDVATDYGYGLPREGAPQVHVGRFPADSPAQVAQMAARTVAYERDAAPGPWQGRLALVTGVLGYNPVVDQVVETLFRQTVGKDVPPYMEVEVAQARPDSPYCPYPPGFSDNALRMLNDGSLLYVYVGHGSTREFDSFAWRDRTFPIFDAAAVDRVSIPDGPPLMVVLACSTGRLDAPGGECIGERIFARPQGPVAYLGASRIDQPYGIALLGKHLIATLLVEPPRTVGEALDEARRRVLLDAGTFRQQVDGLAALVYGPQALENMRQDVVRHYNLLGDPALRLRRPEELRVKIEGTQVSVEAPPGAQRVELILERPLGDPPTPLPNLDGLSGTALAQAWADRYRTANTRAVWKWEGPLRAGAVTVQAPTQREGAQWLRAMAWGPTGAACGAVPVGAKMSAPGT
jgi:hypothetical protein